MIYAAKNVLGVFAFDEKGRLSAYELFPRDAEKVAEKLAGHEIEEEKKLARKLNAEIVFEKDSPTPGGEFLRSNLDDILKEAGCSKFEYEKLLHDAALILSKQKIKKASMEKDRLIVQAVEALDDIDEASNLLSERIREWYSLHFPELGSKIEEHKKYVELIRSFGSRENFSENELKELAAKSVGAELDEPDLKVISNFAEQIFNTYKLRENLESYINTAMKEIAPNLSALAGPLMGAKLIALAGSLDNLARMPGSRIQVIGAEKALFRHIKEHSPPPKHGAIFQYPSVKSAPWWHRGKIARSLASKIAIAARVDVFSKAYVAEKLKANLTARIEEVKKKYPDEPKKKMRIIPRTRAEKRKLKKKRRR